MRHTGRTTPSWTGRSRKSTKVVRGTAPYSILCARHVQRPGRKARKAAAAAAREERRG